MKAASSRRRWTVRRFASIRPKKTLADCFKYRNKLGIDVCVEALNLYRRRGRMKVDQLERYAKLCRVERVMRPYLEAVL